MALNGVEDMRGHMVLGLEGSPEGARPVIAAKLTPMLRWRKASLGKAMQRADSQHSYLGGRLLAPCSEKVAPGKAEHRKLASGFPGSAKNACSAPDAFLSATPAP